MGHQNHLRNCARMGERLLVGVLSDALATSYKRQPVMTTQEREAVVGRFEGVWKVVPAPMVVEEVFLEEHDIDVVCISPEYAGSEYYVVPQELGIVRVMARTEGISTTELIRRIEERVLGSIKK
uniref:ethanolamine-phosphate cytidylyltransferase n=1 Tax=Arcella intermedia TaxID=1963864 RepID=A0A6B2LQL7_9EUKA